MDGFISFLVEKISQANPEFSALELKKMQYGMLCVFDEITKLIPYFFVFYLFSLQNYFIIVFLFFCPIRLFTGGYHAKTYWGCFFITFSMYWILILAGKNLSLNHNILIVFLIISFILICFFSPVDNVNKRIKSKERRKKLKYTSIMITLVQSIICFFLPQMFITTAVLSIFCAVIMMMIGKLNILIYC